MTCNLVEPNRPVLFDEHRFFTNLMGVSKTQLQQFYLLTHQSRKPRHWYCFKPVDDQRCQWSEVFNSCEFWNLYECKANSSSLFIHFTELLEIYYWEPCRLDVLLFSVKFVSTLEIISAVLQSVDMQCAKYNSTYNYLNKLFFFQQIFDLHKKTVLSSSLWLK